MKIDLIWYDASLQCICQHMNDVVWLACCCCLLLLHFFLNIIVRGRNADALHLILNTAPLSTKNQAVKVNKLLNVLRNRDLIYYVVALVICSE